MCFFFLIAIFKDLHAFGVFRACNMALLLSAFSKFLQEHIQVIKSNLQHICLQLHLSLEPNLLQNMKSFLLIFTEHLLCDQHLTYFTSIKPREVEELSVQFYRFREFKKLTQAHIVIGYYRIQIPICLTSQLPCHSGGTHQL